MRPPPKQTFYHHNAVVSPQNGSKGWATSATSIKPHPANINQPCQMCLSRKAWPDVKL